MMWYRTNCSVNKIQLLLRKKSAFTIKLGHTDSSLLILETILKNSILITH